MQPTADAPERRRNFTCRYDRDVWLRVARSAAPKPESFHRRVIPYFELYYFLAGKGELTVDDNLYTLQPGDLLVFKPLEMHQIRIDSSVPFEKISVQFSSQTFAPFDPDGILFRVFSLRPAGRFNVLHPEDFPDDHWQSCLFRLMRKPVSPGDEQLQLYGNLFALCSEVSLALQKRMQEKTEAGFPLPNQVLDYVSRNLISIQNIGQLAQRLNFSPSGLRALFKRTVGTSPQRYLTEKRLELAHSMLIAGTPAHRVCALSGFRDYSAFFRAYKQRFGVSPRSCIADPGPAEDPESFPDDE